MFRTYPQKGMYDTIIETIGDTDPDLELWRECCKYWLGAGWNPKNIDGQLERFTEEWSQATPENTERIMIDGLEYLIFPDGSRELA